MTGKCKGHIFCPQCLEETGKSHVFKSMNHFDMHLIKHAKIKTIKRKVRRGFASDDYTEEIEYEIKTTEDWWPEWGEKFKKLNSTR